MKQQDALLLKGTAVAALVAALALIAIALIQAPVPLDHFAILTGLAPLAPAQRIAYRHYVAMNFSFDNIYLIGHIAMWIGLATVVLPRARILAAAIAVFGLSGASLDFLENALRWTYTKELIRGVPIDIASMRTWAVASDLSFTAIFVAASLAALGMWRAQRWSSVIVGMAVVGIVAMPTTYVGGNDVTFYWLVCWHLAAAFFLWKAGSEAGRAAATVIPEGIEKKNAEDLDLCRSGNGVSSHCSRERASQDGR